MKLQNHIVMNSWFDHRSKIEKLQDRYQQLMRKSFELALRDITASDRANKEACEIKKEISALRNQEDLSA